MMSPSLPEENRFGKGFYLAEDPKTGKAETIYHGSIPTGAVDFEVDLSKMKVLDFSDPATAARWGYDPDADYEHNTLVAEQARAAGFNTIGYPSLRDKGGKNYVVLSDYKELLRPKSYTPFK